MGFFSNAQGTNPAARADQALGQWVPRELSQILGNKDAQNCGPAVRASQAAAEHHLLPVARVFILIKNTHRFADSLLTSGQPLVLLSTPTHTRGDAFRGREGTMPAGDLFLFL